MSYIKRIYEEILEQIDWGMSDEEISELTDIPVDQIKSTREVTDGVLAHEGIIKIHKKLLERALICFRSEHPEEFMHLLKEGDEE